MDIRRLRQVIKYGWLHAGQIAAEDAVSRIKVYFDFLSSYKAYGIWSNQYKDERFFFLPKTERERIGLEYRKKNLEYEVIKKDKLDNRIFLNKWKSYYWELGYERRRLRRQAAYAKRYNMGKNCDISFDVHIECNHNLMGRIMVGDNVMLGKHVYIDYSGEVIIKDNVQITNGVIIESHHHAFHSDPSSARDIIVPTKLIINEGAVLGSRSIILSTCHYIGKNARVGAGAVVTKDVPDDTMVAGVPAKVIR